MKTKICIKEYQGKTEGRVVMNYLRRMVEREGRIRIYQGLGFGQLDTQLSHHPRKEIQEVICGE